MNALVKRCVALMIFGAQSAKAIQPVEVGLQPVSDRIQIIQESMYTLAEQFASDETAPSVRHSVGRRLVELMSERKQLEVEVNQSRLTSRSPLIMYATPRTIKNGAESKAFD